MACLVCNHRQYWCNFGLYASIASTKSLIPFRAGSQPILVFLSKRYNPIPTLTFWPVPRFLGPSLDQGYPSVMICPWHPNWYDELVPAIYGTSGEGDGQYRDT